MKTVRTLLIGAGAAAALALGSAVLADEAKPGGKSGEHAGCGHGHGGQHGRHGQEKHGEHK